MRKPYTRTPIEVRFWTKVPTDVTPEECWVWTGKARYGFGYGVMGKGGHRAGMIGAHRVSWEIHNGPIPQGMVVCHSCDNPPCVNPSHLFLGTQGDNMRDMHAKGRRTMPPSKGELNGNARLSRSQVEQIRSMRGTMSQQKIGAVFGISQNAVSAIQLQKLWRD